MAGKLSASNMQRDEVGELKAHADTKPTVNSEQICQLTALLDRKNLHRHYQATIPIPLQLYLCCVVLPIIPFSLANWQAK